MKKKILILFTGGTIACKQSSQGLVPTASAQDMLSCLPQRISGDFEISLLEMFQLDSSSIGPEHWVQIGETIRSRYDSFDGFLIFHGTDTMAYTASALSFLLAGGKKPIVMTGSQLPFEAFGSDAFGNLKTAFQAFYTDLTGVMIAFDGQLIRGCRASKLRTQSFHAFESINVPPLMNVSQHGLGYQPPTSATLSEQSPSSRFSEAKTSRELFGTKPFFMESRVGLLKLFPGISPALLFAIGQSGLRGLVFELFGAGNFPTENKALMDALFSVSSQGVVIVAKSQCPYEASDLGIYAAGRKLFDIDPISAKDMTTEAAVTKLMWVLGKTDRPEQIRRWFETNVAGEISL